MSQSKNDKTHQSQKFWEPYTVCDSSGRTLYSKPKDKPATPKKPTPHAENVVWSRTLAGGETLIEVRDMAWGWINANGGSYRRTITGFYGGRTQTMTVTALDIRFDPMNQTVMVVHDKEPYDGNV